MFQGFLVILDEDVFLASSQQITGDGVAQLVERPTQDPKGCGLNPVWSTRKKEEFFRVKNVLTCCRCDQPRVYTHAQE